MNKKSLRNFGKNALALTGAVALAVASQQASADAATAIDDAITQGTTLLGKVGPGVIGIAALMTGVGLVISWIRK
ncbi:MAG: hypothetical protein WAW36_08270 [Methylovulum miyakonense]|uniref:hypothetical protein n=1 Tax=Methylovulum miyakonense TaxID=645578 RepID=UPI003BB4C1B4